MTWEDEKPLECVVMGVLENAEKPMTVVEIADEVGASIDDTRDALINLAIADEIAEERKEVDGDIVIVYRV